MLKTAKGAMEERTPGTRSLQEAKQVSAVERVLRGLGWVLLARTLMLAGDDGERAGA